MAVVVILRTEQPQKDSRFYSYEEGSTTNIRHEGFDIPRLDDFSRSYRQLCKAIPQSTPSR